MTNDVQHTVVIGGTGKVGRRVVQRLRARGLAARVASRSGEVRFDWEDPGTWEPALRGADAAYVSYAPDLAVPGAAEAVGEVARLAREAGVRRLVLLSGRGEPEAQRAERAVQEAGVPWTVVRCSWFAQNFSESHLLGGVLAGVVALPVGDVPEPFVDAEDIADVAVAALTEPGHEGQVHELTGPRLLTFAEAVREIADATGRDVRFQALTADEHAALLAEHGVAPAEIALLDHLFAEVLDGRNAHVTDGVRRALGRPPRDFGDYARAVAATGVWQGAATVA